MKKPSKTIYAKTVLADIKAGMPASALMEKHKLSAVGLQSLLRKLGEPGRIRHIDDTDIVRYFKEGILDNQLGEKYRLSEEALKSVWGTGEQGRFFDESPNALVKPGEGVISGKEIVHDLRSGMTRWELMLKYGLSGQQLKKAFDKILKERQKVAMEIAEDVRSGVTALELMQKYQLSNTGLQKVCQKLLKDGLLGTPDVQGLKFPLDSDTLSHHERRQIPRRYPSLQITVCDTSNGVTMGTVKDITEQGLAVRGIEASIGERKTFSILGDDFGFIDPFELEAECRWAGIEGSKGRSVAGFRITAITDQDLHRLQRLIEFIDLGCEENL